jgi:hypothetical protein
MFASGAKWGVASIVVIRKEKIFTLTIGISNQQMRQGFDCRGEAHADLFIQRV